MPALDEKSPPVLFDLIRGELEKLYDILQEEKSALENNDIESLEGLTRNKTQLCASIEELENQRQNQPAEISEAQTADLFALFSEINEMNRLNGIIVTRQLQRSKAALAILSGHAGVEQQTYSESGQSSSLSRSGWVVST